MRKFVFVAVGIISLGAAQQSSAAQKQCEKDLENCLQRVGASAAGATSTTGLAAHAQTHAVKGAFTWDF